MDFFVVHIRERSPKCIPVFSMFDDIVSKSQEDGLIELYPLGCLFG